MCKLNVIHTQVHMQTPSHMCAVSTYQLQSLMHKSTHYMSTQALTNAVCMYSLYEGFTCVTLIASNIRMETLNRDIRTFVHMYSMCFTTKFSFHKGVYTQIEFKMPSNKYPTALKKLIFSHTIFTRRHMVYSISSIKTKPGLVIQGYIIYL